MKRDGTSGFSRPHYSPIGSPAVGQFLHPFRFGRQRGAFHYRVLSEKVWMNGGMRCCSSTKLSCPALFANL